MTTILFPLIPAEDLPSWWGWTPDRGDTVTMADYLNNPGMSAPDRLAAEYGHDDNYASDDQGACASWYRLTDGMRVAFTLACGSGELVKPYAYVRSDDHGFWDIMFADTEAQVCQWLAMWRDENEPHSDDDYADDGETLLVDNARDWEGWDEFTSSYVACAFWSSTGDDGAPLDANYSPEDLSDGARKSIEDDCAAFMFHHYNSLQAVGTIARHGHDFWLTRNRHGAGFWDRGYGDIGEYLSDAAKVYGESNLYVGDDGKVEVS